MTIPPEGRTGYALKRAQHALRLRMDESLREVGLTTPQYAVLSLLEVDPGLSNAELARRAFVTPQTMNGIVAKLEAAGLLTRSAHPTHGRLQPTFLTLEGERSLAVAHPHAAEVERRMVLGLGSTAEMALLDALRTCADALEADRGDGGIRDRGPSGRISTEHERSTPRG